MRPPIADVLESTSRPVWGIRGYCTTATGTHPTPGLNSYPANVE